MASGRFGATFLPRRAGTTHSGKCWRPALGLQPAKRHYLVSELSAERTQTGRDSSDGLYNYLEARTEFGGYDCTQRTRFKAPRFYVG